MALGSEAHIEQLAGQTGQLGGGCPAISDACSVSRWRPTSGKEALAKGAVVLGAAAVGFAGLALTAEGSELTLSETVANHAASRPYVNSQLIPREIMSAAEPIPDPGGVPTALRWDVAGAIGKTPGTWQLVVDMAKGMILHFLFERAK